ncbi:MAG: EAL domain-containing protein [Candidatus Thiodiazotropha sp. (ex Dulcina madagascariensis)]|nr:EAL domain-containing protein [Candidatus Thiodiazotropha sp. (ex Dulcina madagascariensis)]MCU7926065.1 EAL domain-containing protein [Candidatus Thiodiazotropha sp. (ex Dulcina madagascariensis)]
MKSMQQTVFEKQIGLLYAQGGTVVFSGIAVALLVGFYYWEVANRAILLAWAVSLFLLSIARILLFRRFNQVKHQTPKLRIWLRRHILMTFLSGTIWGLLSLFYDPGWPTAHQVVLFVVVAGLAAGSVSAYAAVLEVYVVFLIPLLLPLEIALFVRGDQTTSFLGGFVLLFGIGMLSLARKYHSQVIDTIHLSLEHQFLQDAVSTGSQQLEITEHALRATEQQFGHVLESSLDGFWDWDITNDQIYLSPRWKEQLGFENDELPNEFSSWESRLHPDDGKGIMQKLQAYLAKPWGNWEEEFRLRHKNGSYRWILARATPTFDEKGALIRLTGVHIDITERVFAETKARHLAYHDWLTELPNRLLFNDRVEHAISQAKRTGLRLCILFFDLDRFKHINDSLGHPAGDSVLKRVANRLKETVREGDTLARLGGDEFAVLIENVHHSYSAASVAEKLHTCFDDPFIEEGHEFYLSASVGISVYPSDGEGAAELLKNADAAMYKAKNIERGGFQFYTQELTSNAYQHFTLESGLRHALQEDQFQIYYQPKIDLKAGRVLGAEALLRWRHPEEGFIPPDEFVPVAEEAGLIKEIGEWVLENACNDALEWRAQGLEFGRIAVNLSGVQIQNEAFVDSVKRILFSTGLDADFLELEITENFLMKDAEASARYLQDLRQLGVIISIDDFGTGYSSLAHLARFPVNKLKIDRSFVTNVCHDEQNAEISRTIIGLGHTLGIEVVAEGIEHAEQLDFLRQEGCDEGQGFFISEPLDSGDFIVFLNRYTGGFPLSGAAGE